MAKNAKLYKICCILMAFLFAVSASVQLNDTDWYFWIPLYASASFVNLMSCWTDSSEMVKRIGHGALLLALFLFTKVVVDEDLNRRDAFWSVDLRERAVREKFGSGLVFVSMILQLTASSIHEDSTRKKMKTNTEETNYDDELAASPPSNNLMDMKKIKLATYLEYGMAILLGISYGISFSFLLYQNKDMKF
ncbi:hypothetical protein Nepgr_027086 [Nepenthes gracilis]|uniref:Transmembrane protein 220 n=1 Tax=Nepenthes gracilis TaxID=150966 RepID=A0AAD3Y160_NEPGR|nr:hypothetical protein Nepgr_027086 [Nepenthes gracilis]